MPDAARSNTKPKFIESKSYKTNPLIGYFGSLHKGRGIELIIKIAKINPNLDFCIYGGSAKEINTFKKSSFPNIKFFGFIKPKDVIIEMHKMDLLLMPYQRKVSIGVKDIDTSKWMSPMKLFEYMSSQKPIISSNHKVLEEVLIDQYNCIMLPENDYKLWSKNINELLQNKKKSEEISYNAYSDYLNKYTWDYRARKIIKLYN